MSNKWPYELTRSGNDAITHATEGLQPSIFREYDIRGRIQLQESDSYTIDEFAVTRVGKAFGTYLRQRDVPAIALGYDSRSYSERLANAMMIGLMSSGMSVMNIGLATTPMLYFAQHHLGGVAGVSVTASHNPNGWAGLKLSDRPSVTLGPDELKDLWGIADSREFLVAEGSYTEVSVTDAYIDYLSRLLPAPRHMHVVVDGGNSIAGPIAELVLRAAGYKVTSLNGELDWTFPNHEPDPETVSARQQIARAVTEASADLGISLDGDGDRMGLTDELGNVVWSDQALALLSIDVLSKHPSSKIVYDVKCSRAVGETILAHGGDPVMWMTGHSHIKAKMRELNAPFAGERSGHFFDAGDYLGFDDGIYASLRFLNLVASGSKPVSETVGDLPQYMGTPTMQAECPDEEKYLVVERFAEHAEGLGARELVRINGVRAEFDEGWLLIRASSNLPALVMVAEASDADHLKKYYDFIRAFLDSENSVERVWLNDPYAEN